MLIYIMIFYTYANLVFAESVFKPFVIEADNKEMCDVALEHYN